MTYRPEIDGLRAIAVLSVVAFHLHALAGGFLGVDIFFVISGYLISTIILSEMESGTFSLAKFYERRIKRILPALLAVCATCLVVSVFVFSPANTVEMARTTVAATLSFSNIYFAMANNYFGAYFTAPAATIPLLHTWSLGVEEQFYFTFPLLLMAVRRFLPKHLTAVVWIVFFASLAISTYGAFTFYDPAFYLPQDRAWELALGTLIALGAIAAPANRVFCEAICLTGLAAIVVTMLSIDLRSHVPRDHLSPRPAPGQPPSSWQDKARWWAGCSRSNPSFLSA